MCQTTVTRRRRGHWGRKGGLFGGDIGRLGSGWSDMEEDLRGADRLSREINTVFFPRDAPRLKKYFSRLGPWFYAVAIGISVVRYGTLCTRYQV
jgi:hypothetical protein